MKIEADKGITIPNFKERLPTATTIWEGSYRSIVNEVNKKNKERSRHFVTCKDEKAKASIHDLHEGQKNVSYNL